MLAAEMVTTLLRRVRDPQGSQHPPVVVLRFLTEAQRLLNMLYADVLESAVLEVQPRVMHLPLAASLPSAMRLLGLRTFDGSRDLTELPDWRQLATLDRRWFRKLGDRHLAWAPVGRDAFVVWPGVERITPITAVYVRLTDELALDTEIEIDNGYHPLLLDMVEGCLLLRGRMFAVLPAVIKRLELGFATPPLIGHSRTVTVSSTPVVSVSPGAFQPSAFQNSAYQVGSTTTQIVTTISGQSLPLPEHTQIDVLALAQLLAAGQADILTLIAYYDDAMAEIARAGLFVETRLFPVDARQATVELPKPPVRLIAVCYDDRDLAETSLMDLESLAPPWRDRVGTPFAFTTEDETVGALRLIPVPAVPSKAFSFIHGEPLGVDFPAYVAAVFFTEARVDVPRWLDLPLAFGLVVREFARDSDHMDVSFAAACRQFGQLFIGMVLVDAASPTAVGAG